MITEIRQLFFARELVWSWTERTVRGRYQQSILGWLWAVLQPVASVAIFAVVFTLFVPVDTKGIPYVLFSYTAMVPWTFFSSSLTDMASSLVQNMSLVTKIYFPREAIPIATMLARFLDFAIASILIFVLLIYYHIPSFPFGWLFLPLLILIQVVLVVGLGLACSALNIFYRDVDPFLKLITQVWFYASPIIYPTTLVPENLRFVYFLNPMAGIVQAYRDVLLNQTLPGIYLVEAGIISILVFIAGFWFFKRVEFEFADIV